MVARIPKSAALADLSDATLEVIVIHPIAKPARPNGKPDAEDGRAIRKRSGIRVRVDRVEFAGPSRVKLVLDRLRHVIQISERFRILTSP